MRLESSANHCATGDDMGIETARSGLRRIAGVMHQAIVIAVAMITSVAAQPKPLDIAPTTADAAESLGLKPQTWRSRTLAITHALDVLARERCDQKAILDLGKALRDVSLRRDSATALTTFSRRCGGYAPALRQAANDLLTLSDWEGATATASELIAIEPFGNNGYFLRALAHDRGGNAVLAIDDYVTAIELFPNRAQIANQAFFALARLHDKLGHSCDAIQAVERWVAIDPARYDTSQTRAMIAQYSSRGTCTASRTGEDTARIDSGTRVATIRATIDGVPGMFVVDTGASYVTLTRSFAEKAGIRTESEGTLTFVTANGRVQAKRGRAKHIKLRAIEAEDVAVAVQDGGQSYGKGIDGLLGMSFLSRFDVTFTGGTVRMRARR